MYGQSLKEEHLNKAATLLFHFPMHCHEQMNHLLFKESTLETKWPKESSTSEEATNI